MILMIALVMLAIPLVLHIWIVKKTNWIAIKYIGVAGMILGIFPTIISIIRLSNTNRSNIMVVSTMIVIIVLFYLLFLCVGMLIQIAEVLWKKVRKHTANNKDKKTKQNYKNKKFNKNCNMK